MSPDDELFGQVGDVLASRPGWSFEPSPTPGGPSTWCFYPHGEIALSVNVDHGAISIYLPIQDQEIVVDGLVALAAWLDGNEAQFTRP